MSKTRLLALLAGAMLAFDACAVDWGPGGVVVQAGSGEHSVRAASIGLVWPWAWRHATSSGQWSGYTEAYVGRWNAKDHGRRLDFDHVGIVPLWRYRGAGGSSPWFVEGGIGLVYMDRVFVAGDRRFSTRLNFEDTLGIGRSFGERQRHELTLRFTHFSNGGVKRPNPGQNMVRLRYAYLF